MAILTEALHSGIDLLASLIAFFSVRRAEEPADASHRYGHEKFENAAAAAEGMLILAGSAVIVYAAIRSLIAGPELENLGIGIVVIGFASVANLAVSSWLFRKARETSSPALEGDAAHLRTDAYTSIGVLVGLALVSVTGEHWLDPVVALLIAGAIVITGVRITMGSLRVLVDEALPDDELRSIRDVHRGLRRPRRRRLPPAAHAPGGRAALRRSARPVPQRHLAGGRAPDRARAAGRDPARDRPRRRPDPPRARGPRAARGDCSEPQNRLMPAAIATASTTPA